MNKKIVGLMLISMWSICALAADVTLTTGDAVGTSSFNAAGHWSDGLAPSAGKTYYTNSFLIRTPSAAGNYTFAGDSLRIGGGTVPTDGSNNTNCLINKTPTPATITANITLDGGGIRDGMGYTDSWTLAGTLNVTANNGYFACQETFNINSVISGSGTLYLGDNGNGSAACTFYIASASNTYNGNIYLLGASAARCRLTFADNSRMNFVIGASGVNNKIAVGSGKFGTVVYNGDFAFDLSGASANVGDTWTISNVTSQTFSDTFTVIGFTDAGNNIWKKSANGVVYEFNEGTGILTATLPKPTDPVVEEVTATTIVLHWNAASDPNGVYAVNPNIVDQYVFMSNGNLADPNLYYVGATGVDPGTTNPASKYPGTGTITVATDKTYTWAVVEAMSGHTQTFTPQVSKITQVDPNNIIGVTWTYASPISTPVVPTDQPVSVRVAPTETSAVFTVDFTSLSTPIVKWYKNDNMAASEVTTGINTTNHLNGTYTTTLTITGVTASNEGQYYCTVTNSSGPTAYQSGVANLIVDRLLAQYNFDGTLADSSTNGAPTGTGKSVSGLVDANSLQAVTITPSYVAGVDNVAAHALKIDPNQYVDFTTGGYPKASAVTSNGYGGGLDQGTIVYWIKPNTAIYQIVLGNFNDTTSGNGFLSALQANGNEDILVRNGGLYVANHVAGKPNRPEYNLYDGNWHMMAACWGPNASSLYVDGQWVVNNTDGTPTSYAAWQYSVLLGASRQANRNLLSDMFKGGAIDNMRIYNYRLDEGNVEAFAQEYLNNTGIHPCTNMSFTGNAFNYDNAGSSYCKVDLADFAAFAGAWLSGGLF